MLWKLRYRNNYYLYIFTSTSMYHDTHWGQHVHQISHKTKSKDIIWSAHCTSWVSWYIQTAHVGGNLIAEAKCSPLITIHHDLCHQDCEIWYTTILFYSSWSWDTFRSGVNVLTPLCCQYNISSTLRTMKITHLYLIRDVSVYYEIWQIYYNLEK